MHSHVGSSLGAPGEGDKSAFTGASVGGGAVLRRSRSGAPAGQHRGADLPGAVAGGVGVAACLWGGGVQCTVLLPRRAQPE